MIQPDLLSLMSLQAEKLVQVALRLSVQSSASRQVSSCGCRLACPCTTTPGLPLKNNLTQYCIFTVFHGLTKCKLSSEDHQSHTFSRGFMDPALRANATKTWAEASRIAGAASFAAIATAGRMFACDFIVASLVEASMQLWHMHRSS